jgi:co-chaperonin GroES (HSP10)
MRMLKSNLLVEKLTKTQLGKVVLPDSVEDEWVRGKVIGVGPEISTMGVVTPILDSPTGSEPQIKIGDVVIFPPLTPYGNPHPEVGSDGYIIIPETYIWAIED